MPEWDDWRGSAAELGSTLVGERQTRQALLADWSPANWDAWLEYANQIAESVADERTLRDLLHVLWFGPPPDINQPDAGWQEAMDTRDQATIDAWYDSHTGLEAYWDEDFQRPLTEDDLTPSAGFTTTHDGQIIERLDITGTVTVQHHDVVIQGCRLSLTTAQNGIVINAGADNPTVRFCTFLAPSAGTGGNRAIINRAVGGTFAFNKLNDGFMEGLRHEYAGGAIWEYNHVPRLRRFSGASGAALMVWSVQGALTTIRRNNLKDGTISALSLRSQDVQACQNILVTQNIFNLQEAGQFCVDMGSHDAPFKDAEQDIRYRHNVWGQDLVDTCGNDGRAIGLWVNGIDSFSLDQPGNQFVGNTYMDGTEVPGNQAESIAVVAVSATSEVDFGDGPHLAAWAIDGDPNTRWVGVQGSSITFDLGEPHLIGSVRLLWQSQTSRSYFGTFQGTTDDPFDAQAQWADLWHGPTLVAGSEAEFQVHSWPPVSMRGIRYVGQGNTSTTNNSIREFEPTTDTITSPPGQPTALAEPLVDRVSLDGAPGTGAAPTSYDWLTSAVQAGPFTELVTGLPTPEHDHLGAIEEPRWYMLRARNEDGIADSQPVQVTGPPPPDTWDEAYDSLDQTLVDSWYQANTGPSGHPNSPTLTSFGTSAITVDLTWLQANAGPNVFQEGSRWVLYAMDCGRLIIAHDNVTVRACRITMPNQTGVYGISFNSTVRTGLIVEWTEIDGDGWSAGLTAGIGIHLQGNGTKVVRYCDIHSQRTPVNATANMTVEYCWLHDPNNFQVGGDTAHTSCLSARGNNIVIRRNRVWGGNSNTMGLYAHEGTAWSNVEFVENIFDAEAHYALATYNAATGPFSSNVKVTGNLFGSMLNIRCGVTGSHHRWLGAGPGEHTDSNGNTWGGNRWMLTGNWVAPQTGQFPSDHPDDVYDDPWVAEFDQEAAWWAAWETNDQQTIDDWYDKYTGIDGYWLEPGELDGVNPTVGRYLRFDDLTEFVGTVSSTHNGQEIKFLYIHGNGAPLNIQHSNVKVLGCFVDPFEAGMGSGGLIGLTGTSLSGCEFGYCTFRDSYPGPPEDGLRRDTFYALGGRHPGLYIHHCKWPKDHRGKLPMSLIGFSGTTEDPIRVEFNMMHRERPDPAGRINIFWLKTDGIGEEQRHWIIKHNAIFSGVPIYCRTGGNGQWQPGQPLLSHLGDLDIQYNIFNTGDRNRGYPIVTNWVANSGGSPTMVVWPNPSRANDFGGPVQNVIYSNNKFGRFSYPWCSRNQINESLSYHITHGTVTTDNNRMLGWGNTLVVGGNNPDTAVDGQRGDWSFNGDQNDPPENSSDGWVRNFGEQ